MTTINSISSSAVTGMFQRPPMERNHKLTDEQKDQLQDILSKYDSAAISDEDTKSMMDEIREAGIRPGDDLKTALEDAGFELKPPPGGPGGGRPPMGMGGPMGAGAEPPQFVKDFMDKVQSGEITEDEVTEFVKNVQSQQQQYTGVLFDQAV